MNISHLPKNNPPKRVVTGHSRAQPAQPGTATGHKFSRGGRGPNRPPLSVYIYNKRPSKKYIPLRQRIARKLPA